MGLSRLLFISTKNLLAPGEIFRIHEQGERNNAQNGLTGMLLFSRSYFLQILEGEREQLTQTFTVIAADQRHRRVSLLNVDDIADRTYPDWSMGLLDAASPSVQVVLQDVLPGGLFMPANLIASAAVLMLRRLQTLHLTRCSQATAQG